MKLNSEQKFILPDDDGNLILITEMELDYTLLQNKVISMKGVQFMVDYENNIVESSGKVDIQTSFKIDVISGEDF